MSKTIDLIQTLSKAEQKELQKLLHKSSRTGLVVLYKTLLKYLPKKASKKVLFQATFGRTHSPKEDYLLRNLLRHLNYQIKQFLASQHTIPNNKEQEEELQLLNVLLARKQYKLFLQEWKHAHQKAKKQAQYQHQVELTNVYTDYVFNHAEIKQDIFLTLKAILIDTITSNYWLSQENHKELELKLAAVERHLLGFDTRYTMQAPINPFQKDNQPLPDIIRFLEHLKNSYLTHGSQKIEVLQEALTLHPQIASIRPQHQNRLFIILGNLATEYFLLQEFEKAAQTYHQILPLLTKEKPLSLRLNLLFNYCSNEAYLGNYQTIIDNYLAWEERFKTIPKFYYRFQYITCMAYVFSGQAQQAFELLFQENINHRPESDYYYARNLYAIIYYELDDWENCERELTNTLQALRYKPTAEQSVLYRTQLLKDLLKIRLDALNQTKTKKELTQLSKTIIANIDKRYPGNFQNLIVQWILKKIEILLN